MVSKKKKKAENKRYNPAENCVPTGGYEITGGNGPSDFYVPTGNYIPTGSYVPTGGYVTIQDHELYGFYIPTGDYEYYGMYVPSGNNINEEDESSEITRNGSNNDLFERTVIKPIILLKGNPNKISLPKGYLIPPIILV